MDNIQFKDLEIDGDILRAIEDMGFSETTPIQSRAIPVILSGADIIGQAQTGTGKTAAFGIPIMQMVDIDLKKPQVIILSPTRELVIQIANELHKLSKYQHNLKVLPIYGGQDIMKQIRPLKKGVQIIVGTPGRVMDHLRRKTFTCDHITKVILDEADEMLNMGFREDIETILKYLPEKRQTILFSATMPRPILEITKKYQNDAVKIQIKNKSKELTVENIEQSYYTVGKTSKTEILSRLLDLYKPKLSLVFCNTKRMVDELAVELKGRGYFADGLHGDMKQSQRDQVMRGFRNGSTSILIATDVAARGIDVDDIEAVFNFDLPQDDEYYIHRIGRTGRAGKTGRSFSFVRGKEMYRLRDIEKYCKIKIEKKPIPSAADVTKSRVENLMNEVRTLVEKEDLSVMEEYIQKELDSSEGSAIKIAAAFLKKEIGATLVDIPDITYSEVPGNVNKKDVDRLFINIGKSQNVQPGDIVGAIAGEANIPGSAIGAIDMLDKFTFVEIPKAYTEQVLQAMSNAKIKGKSVHIEISKNTRKKSGRSRR